MSIWKRVAGSVGAVLCMAAVAAAVPIMIVNGSSRAYRFNTVAEVPAERVALIFGALVYRSGEPSPVLRDRVLGGVELYEAGKVKKLLMSGGNLVVDYNEVQAMKNVALAAGIPEEDIVLDYGGRSTYDSCYRARHIFGVERVVLVTQRFHISRATYTCRSLGIDAVGYGLPDFEKYPDLRTQQSVREPLAQIKAWYEVVFSKRPAQVMGEKEPEI